MIEVVENVFINPDEVASVEEHVTTKYLGSFSDSYPVKDFEGSRVILKSGRKIYIKAPPIFILKKLGLVL
jgi:hypothetical protein